MPDRSGIKPRLRRCAAPVLLLAAAAALAAGCGAAGGRAPLQDHADAIRVIVLTSAGCAATPPTIERIVSCAARLELDVTLVSVSIENSEDAKRARFFGSPTVQVNGVDIDPSARTRSDYGLG